MERYRNAFHVHKQLFCANALVVRMFLTTNNEKLIVDHHYLNSADI